MIVIICSVIWMQVTVIILVIITVIIIIIRGIKLHIEGDTSFSER